MDFNCIHHTFLFILKNHYVQACIISMIVFIFTDLNSSFPNFFNYSCFLLGPFAGTVLGMPLSGLIADNFGWPWVFYSFGKYSILELLDQTISNFFCMMLFTGYSVCEPYDSFDISLFLYSRFNGNHLEFLLVYVDHWFPERST